MSSEISNLFSDTAEALHDIGVAVDAVLATVGEGGGGGGITRQQRVVQQVLASAGVSMERNQYVPDANLGITVTLTGSNTLDTDFTKSYPAVGPKQMWNYLGGKPTQNDDDASMVRLICATTQLTGERGGHTGSVETILDGDELIVVALAGHSGYRFLVEEGGMLKYIDRESLSSPVSGSGKVYYKLSFTGAQRRRVVVELNMGEDGHSASFGGFYVKDGDVLLKPSVPAIRATWVSDSNLASATRPTGDNHGSIAAAHLGLKDAWISSVGTTGATGANIGQPKWSQRDSDWLDNDSDIIVFVAPWSDTAFSEPEDIPPALIEAVAKARTECPNAIIMMSGFISPEDEYGPTMLAMNAAIRAGIEAMEDNYIRYLDTEYGEPAYGNAYSTPPVGNMLHMIVGIDNGHWGKYGNHVIGRIHADRIVDALQKMYYGIPDVTAEPVTPSLSATSGTQSFTSLITKTIDLATPVGCTLTGIASVTPALPAGLTATVGAAGTKLRITGTAEAAEAAADYVIVVNTSAGGTLTYTSNLTVAAGAASAYAFNVTFDGEDTDTSLTDSLGVVWTPVGGATLDGVVPSGGGFQTVDSAALAAAILGDGDFSFEIKFKTAATDVTLLDLGAALGLPVCGAGGGGGSNPTAGFYSTATGWLGGTMSPVGMDFSSNVDYVLRFYRQGGVQKADVNGVNIAWGSAANTHDYSAEPTKITLGTLQSDATTSPFVGKIYYAKLKVGSI